MATSYGKYKICDFEAYIGSSQFASWTMSANVSKTTLLTISGDLQQYIFDENFLEYSKA